MRILIPLVILSFAFISSAERELKVPVFSTQATRDSVNTELDGAGIHGVEREFCHEHVKELAAALDDVPEDSEESYVRAAKVMRLSRINCLDATTFPADWELRLRKAIIVDPQR